MRVAAIAPTLDGDLAAALLAIQRAAYEVEASLIGDHRIPPLHEAVEELRSAPLRWLGAFDDAARLIGAVAWTENPRGVDIDRLEVDPAVHRRGTGRELVQAVISQAAKRRMTVSTGRQNAPARMLYRQLGFEQLAQVRVAGTRIASPPPIVARDSTHAKAGCNTNPVRKLTRFIPTTRPDTSSPRPTISPEPWMRQLRCGSLSRVHRERLAPDVLTTVPAIDRAGDEVIDPRCCNRC